MTKQIVVTALIVIGIGSLLLLPQPPEDPRCIGLRETLEMQQPPFDRLEALDRLSTIEALDELGCEYDSGE